MLARTRDAQGRAWDIVEVPAPDALRDELDWVDYSFINRLVVNGGCTPPFARIPLPTQPILHLHQSRQHLTAHQIAFVHQVLTRPQ